MWIGLPLVWSALLSTICVLLLSLLPSCFDVDILGHRKFPVGVAERSDSIKLQNVSTKGPANTSPGNKVTIAAESEDMSSYELSDLSAVTKSGRGRNFQENILERDKVGGKIYDASLPLVLR